MLFLWAVIAYNCKYYHIAIFLLLLLCQQIVAQKPTADDIRQLEEDMYRYYSDKQTDLFLETTRKLKEVCQRVGNDRLFYKAWGNEAIYIFTAGDRAKGLKIANEVYEHAVKTDCKIGLYSASYALGTLQNAIRSYDQAEALFLKAIECRQRYLPGESAAAAYLGLAKTYYQRGQFDEVVKYARKALAEPGVVDQHQMSAWSFICIADINVDSARFVRDYLEREKVKKRLGHDDNYGSVIECRRAMLHGNLEEALHMADLVTAPISRMEMRVRIYEKWELYKEAFFSLKLLTDFKDSINKEELAKQIAASASELSATWAKNEAKDLRIANQQLLLENVSRELEQHKLVNETAALKLKNREIELEHASMKLKTDSLDKVSHALMLSEYESRARMRNIQVLLGSAIIMLLVGFLLYILWHNKRHIKKLKRINSQLMQSQQAEHEARKAAEKALNVKRNFLNNISHEMRTPLNTICGFSDLLTMPGVELPDEEKADLKQRINESADVLMHVVDGMLELSHYDSIMAVEQDDEVWVNALCQDVLSGFSPKMTHDVELLFTTEVDDTLAVKTNEVCLRKTLHHLIDNAVKYTTHGHVLVQVTDRIEPDRLTFSVADTGPGIPIESQKSVFELFVETGEQVKTTGMGMSVCKMLVNLLDGSISIDPDYTDGCRVVFTIAKHVASAEPEA